MRRLYAATLQRATANLNEDDVVEPGAILIRKQPKHWMTIGVLIFCAAFGLALIANVQLAAEGSWYWYASLLRHGVKLYADLKFSLQPLFVLETAWFAQLLGESWLASKAAAVFHLALFTVGMFLVVARSNWSDRQKAIVLFAAFFIGIHFEAYRFDDYHALADSFVIYVVLLQLTLSTPRSERTQAALVAASGVLAGLSIALRLNDGAALFCAAALTVVIFTTRRFASLVLFSACTGLTVFILVGLTGDSLINWATYSFLNVAAIKGGTGQFAQDPARIVSSATAFLFSSGGVRLLQAAIAATAWMVLVAAIGDPKTRSRKTKLLVSALALAVMLVALAPTIMSGDLVTSIQAIGALTCYGLAIAVAVRAAAHFLNPPQRALSWDKRELIFFVPFVGLLSGSLSSAGSFVDLYAITALLILLVPVISPFELRGPARSIFLTIAALGGLSGACFRYNDPASWIDYRTDPLFVDRHIVDHPTYGPMIIDDKLFHFITSICAIVNDGDGDAGLLSAPWPYANYYCAIPPWHGFVQTWFDTTSRPVIDSLTDQLRTSPPKWILYQREPEVLAAHEFLFNSGLPLPQHALDSFIMGKIETGEWRIASTQNYGMQSTWILIRTRWPVSPGKNLLTNPNGSQGLFGWTARETAATWKDDRRRGHAIVATNSTGEKQDSILWRGVSFPRTAVAEVHFRTEARGLANDGSLGYSVDLYDAAADRVIGTAGWSNTDSFRSASSFSANVERDRPYEVRLRYSGGDGTVSFSDITVHQPSANVGFGKAGTFAPIPPGTTDLAHFTPSVPPPVWSSDSKSGGRIVVTHAGGGLAESALSHAIRFAREGPATVQLRIGASALDPQTGFGYVADLFDTRSQLIVGSLGVPAVVSEPRRYTFTAHVNATDSYRLRLRFRAAWGTVSFSQIKVEYGPTATAWSDEASKQLLPARATSTRRLARSHS